MSQSPTPSAAPPGERPGLTTDEVDLWWGACSPWALMPSFLVCFALTGAIVWASWYLVQRGWAQPVALAVGSALWAVQCFRWARRVFGFNYRLTTRRLIVARGVLRMRFHFVELREIEKVLVSSRRWERAFGLGTLLVWREGITAAALRLEGVAQPYAVAEQLRGAVAQARGQTPPP